MMAAAGLLATACGSGSSEPVEMTDPTTAPTTAATTTTSEIATTEVPTTTTTTAVTSTTVAVETVGSPAVLEAQIDAVYDFLDDHAAPRDKVPFPDATNPDPLLAFEALINFHFWMVSTDPEVKWVKIYALDGTDYALGRRNQADRYGTALSLMNFDEEEPFTFLGAEVIEVAAVEAPNHVTTDLPSTAVGIEYVSTVGDFYVAVVADGRVFEEYDGWTDLISHAIVVPTTAGWRIAFVRWND